MNNFRNLYWGFKQFGLPNITLLQLIGVKQSVFPVILWENVENWGQRFQYFYKTLGRWLCWNCWVKKKTFSSLTAPMWNHAFRERDRRRELYSSGSCWDVMRLHIDQCLSSISVIRRLTAFLFAGLACFQDNKQQHLWLVSEFSDLEHWASVSVANALVCFTAAKQRPWKREAWFLRQPLFLFSFIGL